MTIELTTHCTVFGMRVPRHTYQFLEEQRAEADQTLQQAILHQLRGADWGDLPDPDPDPDHHTPLGPINVPSWIIATAVAASPNARDAGGSFPGVWNAMAAQTIRAALIASVDDAIADGQQDGP